MIRSSQLFLCTALLLLLIGCTTVTTSGPLRFDFISQTELEQAYPGGPDRRVEARRVTLSKFQKSEYKRLTHEVAPDTVFFYTASVDQTDDAATPVGEIYIAKGMTDAGPFSCFIFVSGGVVRQVTLREPGSIENWDRLAKMFRAYEGRSLKSLQEETPGPIARRIRRALVLHQILTPPPAYTSSPIKPV